jgi:hypothetical protein
MVPALLIGRGGSRGVPGKNTMKILGRPLMTYPILAAKNARHVKQGFLSTDAKEIKEVGRANGLEIIDRPTELSTDTALVEDVIVHAFQEMQLRIGHIKIFVLLFCNSATIMPGIIDKGIEILRKDLSIDSAVSVSLYNEFSPVRAKRINAEGLIVPYGDIDSIPAASCDRDSAEPSYFCDCSVWILRSSCVDLDNGILPFRWMGKKSVPLYQQGGLDIDHDYGIAMTEHWLTKNGFTETQTPYDKQ